MNNFTKEELENIKSCVYFDGYQSEYEENMHQELINKIQSMIDNYCEHETIIPKLETVCRCSKCNNVVECIPI